MSRTTTPQSSPLTWHMYRASPADPSPVVHEMQQAWAGAVPLEAAARQAEILSRMEAARHGELGEPDDIRPIRRRGRDELFEIRWTLAGRPFRLYFAEPPLLPGYLVGLRFHEKSIQGSEHDVRERQNAEIEIAMVRLHQGRGQRWGLP